MFYQPFQKKVKNCKESDSQAGRLLFITHKVTVNFYDITILLIIFATLISRGMLLISDKWMDLPETVDLKLAVWV